MDNMEALKQILPDREFTEESPVKNERDVYRYVLRRILLHPTPGGKMAYGDEAWIIRCLAEPEFFIGSHEIDYHRSNEGTTS